MKNRGFAPIIVAIVVVVLSIGAGTTYTIVKNQNDSITSASVVIEDELSNNKEEETSEEIEEKTKSELEDTPPSENIVSNEKEEIVSKVNTIDEDKKNYINQNPENTVPPVIESSEPEDFRVKCGLSRDKIEVGDTVILEIDVLFDNNSNYELNWNEGYLVHTDGRKAWYEISNPGDFDLTTEVIRKSDGYSKNVTCSVKVDAVEQGDFSNDSNTTSENSGTTPEYDDIVSYNGFTMYKPTYQLVENKILIDFVVENVPEDVQKFRVGCYEESNPQVISGRLDVLWDSASRPDGYGHSGIQNYNGVLTWHTTYYRRSGTPKNYKCALFYNPNYSSNYIVDYDARTSSFDIFF